MSKMAEKFIQFMEVLKNVMWCWKVVVIIFGFIIAIYIPKLDATMRIFCGIISVLIIILIWIGVSYWQLRKRWKRFSDSAHHIHRLTHNLRKNIGKQCQPNWDGDWTPEIIKQHLIDTLERILNDGATCLSRLTGEEVTSCLLMPVGKRKKTGNLVFRTVLYGGNPPDDRINSSMDHERNVIQHAYDEQKPFIHHDYEKEYKRGKFFPPRPNWQEYYMSSIMTSFTVGKQPTERKVWGVLSFDCPKKKAFKEDWKYLVCAFSDALGLVLSLQDPCGEQWSVDKEL